MPAEKFVETTYPRAESSELLHGPKPHHASSTHSTSTLNSSYSSLGCSSCDNTSSSDQEDGGQHRSTVAATLSPKSDRSPYKPKPVASSPSSTPSLYHRIGGEPTIRLIIREFYARILSDEGLSMFFDKSKMASLRVHQLHFLRFAFDDNLMEDQEGGDARLPDELCDVVMRGHIALFKRGLSETHFDMVEKHFVNSMNELKVDAALAAEVGKVIHSLRPVFERGAKKYGKRNHHHHHHTDHHHKHHHSRKTATDSTDVSTAADSNLNGETTTDRTDESTAANSNLNGEREVVKQNNPSNLLDELGGFDVVTKVAKDLEDLCLSDPALNDLFSATKMSLHARKAYHLEFVMTAVSSSIAQHAPQSSSGSSVSSHRSSTSITENHHAAAAMADWVWDNNNNMMDEIHLQIITRHLSEVLLTLYNVSEESVLQAQESITLAFKPLLSRAKLEAAAARGAAVGWDEQSTGSTIRSNSSGNRLWDSLLHPKIAFVQWRSKKSRKGKSS